MTQIKLNAKLQKHLISRGLPRDLLRARPYVLDYHVVTLISTIEGMKTKKVLKTTQLDHFQSTLLRPFANPYIYIIGSSPNDSKAKQAAAYLMDSATKDQLSGKFPRSTRGRQSPLWHMITGSFNDRLRDGAVDEPSMIIFSNITVNSTTVKLEKLRDLLEMYNHIPRIVVITGEDPITFANTKLMLSVNHVLNLATARKISL